MGREVASNDHLCWTEGAELGQYAGISLVGVGGYVSEDKKERAGRDGRKNDEVTHGPSSKQWLIRVPSRMMIVI
jgi:hypothetical protein